ncbi:MAG: hypothetical protein RL090_235 [Bacteroidota bacterium]
MCFFSNCLEGSALLRVRLYARRFVARHIIPIVHINHYEYLAALKALSTNKKPLKKLLIMRFQKSLLFQLLCLALMMAACNQPKESSNNSGGSSNEQENNPVNNESDTDVAPEATETDLSSEKNQEDVVLSDDSSPVPVDRPGYITKKGVLMRSSYSTQSQAKATFKEYENVLVLEEYQPTNTNEGITKTYVKLYDEYGQHAETLNPGRAVKIIGREGGKVTVSFQSTKRKKLTAKIDRSEIKMIGGDLWYRVKRDNGQVGWVFGDYVEFDDSVE